MADAKWTPLQERAITLQGCDILVSAAAGAGKTSVLVERLVRRILDPAAPLDLERLLAVTFTEKAAAEMKERIRASLERASREVPRDPRIERQLLVLDRAQISTIHAFCLSVLRRYFYKAGLDPRFRVLDENEAELLRQDALSEMFETLYDDDGETGDAFRNLVDRYGGKAVDEGLQSTLLRIHSFARAQASMDGWLDHALRQAEPPGDSSTWDSPWMRHILERAAKDLVRAIGFAEEALRICGEPHGPAAYAGAVLDDIDFYKELAAAVTGGSAGQVAYERAMERFGSFGHKRLGRVSEDCDPEKQELAKELRDAGKKVLGQVAGYAFARPPEDLAAELRKTAPFVRTLVALVRDLDNRFTAKKADRGGVDFSDLERYCLSVLEQDGCRVAAEVRKGFDCVLVDEYQDTNPLQERILSLVSAQEPPGNRFMVGDLKQSIYRFRLAEPRIFLEKFRTYRTLPEEGAPVAGKSGVRIDLTHNFRSRAEVVDAVNYLFDDFMRASVAEIEYKDGHGLVRGASYPDPGSDAFRAEMHLVERQEARSEDEAESDDAATEQDRLEEFEALEKEALVVADRVRAFVDPGKPLMLWDSRAGTHRPCSYRDIAILMRSTKDRANSVLQVLNRCDVPAYADTGAGYFQAREVEVALALLKVIDNPRQDIPLAAVLRSPVVGLTPADLARVRAAHKRGPFYEAVRAYLTEGPDGGPAGSPRRETPDVERARITASLERFFVELDRWRTLARRRPLAEVTWTILRETGYHDYAGGLPGGPQRQANLRALCDRARQFDSFGRHGLFRFLRFVEKLQDAKGDLGTARALGEQEDVVRVMSVHKAKGLEFPVVFAIDLGKQFNLEDTRQDVLYHRDLGIAPVYCDIENRVKYPTGLHRAIAMKVRDENLAEEMRVLYVALTRAKEKLVMVGSARDLPRRMRKWKRTDPASAVTCLDWVCPALLRSPGAPIDLKLWGTEEGSPVPAPSAMAAKSADLAWREVRELKAPAASNPVLYKEIERRLGWSYSHPAATATFAKLSVGEFRHRLEDEEDDAWREDTGVAGRPRTLEAGPLAPAGEAQSRRLQGAVRGVAVHALLSRMRLESGGSLEGVREEAARLLDLEMIESPGLDERDIRNVARFFETETGRELTAAPGKVRREVPFTMRVPSGALAPSAGSGARDKEPRPDPEDFVIVQGVIDVLVDNGEDLAILDYKTDEVREEALQARSAAYLPQIALYALAAEKILKKPVRRASIVFLSCGRVVDADWKRYLRSVGLVRTS